MFSFNMNGYRWHVRFCSPYSSMLIDRTGRLCLATTDPNTSTVYLSNSLAGAKLRTVLLHELGHCAMFSYGLLDEIHSVVDPSNWIEAEEWICNFLADYGDEIFDHAGDFLSVADGLESLLA